MDPALGRIERWSHARFQKVWTGVLILVAPAAHFRAENQVCSPWRRIWELLSPHRGVLLQTLVGAIATTILGLGMSIYVQKIVDHVIPKGNRSLLNLLAMVMLATLAFKLILGWCQSILSLRTAQRIDAGLILAYYRHLMRLPQNFFDTMRVGEITSRVGDAVKIRNFLSGSLLNLLLNPLVMVFSLAAMFIYAWPLALLSLALIPSNALVYTAVNHLNRKFQRQIMERTADLDAQLVESLSAQGIIRRFKLEDHAALRTETRLVRLLQASWNASIGQLGSSLAATLLTQVYVIGLLWLGAGLVLEAKLTPGQLMSCYTLAGFLSGPISSLIGLNNAIQEMLIAADRLFELMDLEREADEGLLDLPAEDRATITFENVGFKHPGRLATLQGVSVVIPATSLTVLVGESGCGKSTMLSLLQRLYEPNHGRILRGQHDLRYFRLGSLRRRIAVVPQQTQLLSGTILENLVSGETRPDMNRLLGLCRDAGALAFIEELPRGFMTFVREGGANLSGGQRQRLALVRALYLDAPILLLDEPTSALDMKSEGMVLALLEQERARGKTVVVATHSQVLRQAADWQIFLHAGQVVQAIERISGSKPSQTLPTGQALLA
jgi:ATP-binding cassette, subfamily C, bacteriocin exporter